MLDKFLKDLAIYLPSKLLPALTAFITVPILTRLLAPAEFGNYALAIGVCDFLFAMTCSGLGAGAVRFYSAYQVQGRLGSFFAVLGASLVLAIAGGCAASLGLLLLFGDALPADLQPLLFISVLIFGVQAAYIVLMQVVRAQERSRLYTTFELLTNYGSLALGLALLAIFGWGVSGLLWGAFLAFAVALAVLFPLITRNNAGGMRQFESGDMGMLWRYAWPLAVGNMAMWGLRLSDRYLLGVFQPRAEVGLYSAAYNISGKSIDILVAVFLLSMGPMVINTWEKMGQGPTQQALKSTTRVFLIMCLPAAAGLSVLAKPFVELLTDLPYHDGYRIVGFVAFSSFVYGLAQIVGIGLLLAKRTNRIAVNQVLAALINLGLNLILVPRFGFIAAGATTLVGYGVFFALQAESARRYMTWPFPYRTLRNVVAASAATCIIAAGIYALSGSGDGVSPGYLSLSVVAAIAMYVACLQLLGEFESHEVAVVRHMVGRVTHRLKTTPAGES